MTRGCLLRITWQTQVSLIRAFVNHCHKAMQSAFGLQWEGSAAEAVIDCQRAQQWKAHLDVQSMSYLSLYTPSLSPLLPLSLKYKLNKVDFNIFSYSINL